MTNAVALAQMGGISPSWRNRIINGDFTIDQRNNGASVTPTASTYVLDRWSFQATVASKYSVQQNAGSVTPPLGFTNYAGVTSLSSYTVGASEQFAVFQAIEGFNTADLGWGTANAQTITISFWVRSSLTGVFGGSIRNSATNRSYPFAYTITSANTWEQKSITIAGDTAGTWVGATNGVGLYLTFGFGVGSTFSGTAGSWAAGNFISTTGATSVVGTNGATFYITGVQLEKGSVATSFDYLPYTTELQLCQRYCVTYGTVGGNSRIAQGNWGTSTAGQFGFIFPVEMRAAPSLVVLSNGYALIEAVAWYLVTGTPVITSESTTKLGMVSFNVASSAATAGLSSYWGAGGISQPRCQFSAEL